MTELGVMCNCYQRGGQVGLAAIHLADCPISEAKAFIMNGPAGGTGGANISTSINPSYYHGDSVMLFIEQFKLSFCLGNTVKYIARQEHKGKLEDLKKARWYLEREIANLEKENA